MSVFRGESEAQNTSTEDFQSVAKALQDYFEQTQCGIFKRAATYNNITYLEEYTDTAVSYVRKCMNNVTIVITIKQHANHMQWLTRNMRSLLKACNATVISGDKAAYSLARRNLSQGIREAKKEYGQTLDNHFKDSKDTHFLWHGFQTKTYYKFPTPHVGHI